MLMNNYNLSFISNADLFNHVQKTVEKYRFTIDLAEFNKNIIDPTMSQRSNVNTVFAELEKIAPNLSKSLYLLAFKKYQGFEDFEL